MRTEGSRGSSAWFIRQSQEDMNLSRASSDLCPKSTTILELWLALFHLPSNMQKSIQVCTHTHTHTPPFSLLCHFFPPFSASCHSISSYSVSPVPSPFSPLTMASVPLSPPLLGEPGSERGDGKLVQMTGLTYQWKSCIQIGS